ncbi:TRAP transporter substrate-binding protein DctP [Pararhodobacter sp. SW119]|uniref:TRAP transporter substrate-binding protein DctP n=1 Tax=Pararhodobacter sp. SW119 TaxID=2780075 RepID=UPI001ADF62C7|nr:TRAP transporter substrate-binding protein DctP [Pararhodobacter sp. SW119]
MSTITTAGKTLLLASTILVGGAVTGTVAAQDVSWRAVTHQLPGTSRFDGTVTPFAECVGEASGGRMEIQAFGGGVLLPVTDTLDAVRDGIIEMGLIWPGYWAGKNPVFALAGSRPGDPITTFSESFYRAERLHDVVAEAYEGEGVTSLGAFDFGPAEILNSNVEVRSLADFEGKRIRAAGIGATFYNELGASAVTLTGTEIYQALQLGTVDMAEFNDWLVNKEMGFHEVTRYVIEPAMHTGAVDDKDMIVNPAAWDGLDDDLKAIVLTCRDRARYLSSIAYGIGTDRARQEWLDSGVEIIDLPEEEIAEARLIGARVIREFAERNPQTAEFVRIYAEVLDELGHDEMADLLTQGD